MARSAPKSKQLQLYGPPAGLRPREIVTGLTGGGRIRLPNP
jgi:hypothetical protein